MCSMTALNVSIPADWLRTFLRPYLFPLFVSYFRRSFRHEPLIIISISQILLVSTHLASKPKPLFPSLKHNASCLPNIKILLIREAIIINFTGSYFFQSKKWSIIISFSSNKIIWLRAQFFLQSYNYCRRKSIIICMLFL